MRKNSVRNKRNGASNSFIIMASKRHIEPITSSNVFQIEQENNQRKFIEMLKRIRPEIWVIMDILDQTGINDFVIVKTIRQLNNIALGTGWGTVKIEVQNGRVLFIRGEDNDRLDEPLLIPKKGI